MLHRVTYILKQKNIDCVGNSWWSTQIYVEPIILYRSEFWGKKRVFREGKSMEHSIIQMAGAILIDLILKKYLKFWDYWWEGYERKESKSTI